MEVFDFTTTQKPEMMSHFWDKGFPLTLRRDTFIEWLQQVLYIID